MRSSGNLFRDFGYANAELGQAKVVLGAEIMHVLNAEGLYTRVVDAHSSVSHDEFSRIRQAKFSRFRLDRLMGIASPDYAQWSAGLTHSIEAA